MGVYLEKLKDKCKLDIKLYNIINDVFSKLVNFGYITNSQIKNLEKKLYNNIDVVYIGDDIKIDYKTGYYDSIKKELYLKDLSNLESVYLRIIYALTTTKINSSTNYVGFSKVYLSKRSYKIEFENFGINRAVVSNLVCRLLNTDPTTLSIVPTYKTYENDFLGNKIKSDNDIYYLESKLLNQLCYILDINIENLYIDLFKTNKKYYFEKLFEKIKFKNYEKILSTFDTISLNYSNYNKLTYLNKLLNDNFLNVKRRIPGSNIEDLEAQKEKIILLIQNSLQKIIKNYDEITNDDILQPNIETRLSEQITNLENKLIDDIYYIQKLEADFLILNENVNNTISYSIKLKKLENISILKNTELSEYIFKIITEKLMFSYEKDTSSNIEKIKYSIINEILSNEKYLKIYEGLNVFKMPTLKFDEGTEIIILTIDNTFIQFIQIENLLSPIENLNNNALNINIDNIEYILNNHSINKDISTIEKIYAALKTKYPDLSSTKLKDIYITKLQNYNIALIPKDENFIIIQINLKDDKITTKKLKLSDPYKLFNPHNFTNIPIIYKKKAGINNIKENKAVNDEIKVKVKK